MPKAFDDCVKKGGRVRSKRLSKTNYLPICYIDNKSYPGHEKKYKKVLKGKR
jgi:hypothetical protein